MKRQALAGAFALVCAGAAGAAPETACGPAQAGWRGSDLAPAAEGGLDLSFLNDAPAGRHGFVEARGEAFAFADGTPARFWGVNVAAQAIFETPDAAIDAHAERIAQLGFNLVRLHHHDSNGWQKRTVISERGDGSLDPVAVQKLDRWIAQLKARGVYVWLDLHTGRSFRREENIPGFDELTQGTAPWPSAKGFLFVNPRLEQLVLDFAEHFLGHRNEFTGLRYRDDPALVAVLVTNENDLVHHFGNLFTRERANAWHRARYLAAAAEFSARTGLPRERLERTWEPGPGKLLLAELEHRFDARARVRLRKAGVRVPIALTSYWGHSSLAALASLSAGDFVDAHSYANGDALRGDPRRQLGLLGWIGAAQLAGKPVSVSEWNHGKPLQRERFETPLWTAGVAALQDWDALMLFAYAQKSLDRPRAALWNAVTDPATMALMPAASLLYRRGDVAPARKRYRLAPSREVLFFAAGAPEKSAAIATLLEQSRVALAMPRTAELPWLSAKLPAVPPAEEAVEDLRRSFLAAGVTSVRSDTGELEREFVKGILRIDTPRSQLAVGALAGESIDLSRTRIRAEQSAAVAFTSLDAAPLDRARRVLVSVAARACALGAPPVAWRAEPVRGTAWLRAPGARVLVPLDGKERGRARALLRQGEELVVPLDFGGSWALIEPVAGAVSRP